MAEIDSLSIRISAECSKAITDVNRLSGSINSLAGSLRKAGTSGQGFGQLSSGLRNLSTAMASMKGIDGRQFSTLAKNINKLYKIDGSQLVSAGQGIQAMATSLGSLSATGGNAILQINQLASAISSFGKVKATQGIANLPQLTTSLSNMMSTLSQAPIVSSQTIRLVEALAKLSEQGQKVGSASKGVQTFMASLGGGSSVSSLLSLGKTGLNLAITGVKKLSSAISGFINKIKSFFNIGNKITSMFGKFFATYWLLIRAFSLFKKAIDISSDLTEVQNVIQYTFGTMSDEVETFSKEAITNLGMSELKAKEVASTFQAISVNMGMSGKSILKASEYVEKVTNGYAKASEKAGDLSLALTQLTGDMASFYNKSQDVVAQDLQAIFTGQTKPLRKYGIDLTETNLKQWALNEGLNANIKSMTQAEKTLLRYQYVMAHTKASQGDFLRTADSWHNQITVLKANIQQLANVIGTGLINALKPLVKWLNQALLSLTNFANTVINSLGAIFGWKYEDFGGAVIEDSVDAMDDYADATDDASESVKKLKAQLQGFDKLNNLTSDSGKGSGSNGGSSLISSSSDGKWEKTEGLIDYFKSSVENLKGLGDLISKKLAEEMESIDWDTIYQKAKNFGTGLADFLNGLFDPKNKLFADLGSTIAKSLNTVLYSIFSFSKEFKWEDFGTSLANGINGFFEDFDFELAGETIGNITSGLSTSLFTAVKNIKWGEIGTKIGVGINSFFEEMNKVNESTGLNGWQSLGKTVSLLADGLLVMMLSAISKIDWVKVGESISDFISEIDWVKIGFDFNLLVNSIFSAIVLTICSKREEQGKNLGKNIVNTLEKAWDTAISWWDNNKPSLSDITAKVDDLKDKISKKWDVAKTWWNEKKPSLDTITASVANLQSKLSSAWDIAKDWWNGKNRPKLNTITTTVEDIKKKVSDAWDKVVKWAKDKMSIKIKVTYDTKWSGVGKIEKLFWEKLGFNGKPKLGFYKNGGFPETSDIFFANENGVPELVGTMGGKPAVASGQEITGITNAIYDTSQQELQLLRQQNILLNKILAKEFGISSNDIFNSVRQSDRQYSNMNGHSAFAY